MRIILRKSKRENKKYVVEMQELGHTHHFGDSRYNDFTVHGDEKRKSNYLARNWKQDWTKSNIHSPAFFARWLLWNKYSIKASIKDVEKKFNVKIIDKR